MPPALKMAKTALEAGQWTLIVQRDRPRHWRRLTPEHQQWSRGPPSFTLAGPVPDALTGDDFCDAFLRCLPDFLFRSFGSKIHPRRQSLDLGSFFNQATEGSSEPAEAAVEQHVYSRAALEEACSTLAALLLEVDLHIASWHPYRADEELDTPRSGSFGSGVMKRPRSCSKITSSVQ
ncbi:hypothetical protein MOQ72_21895 [Saccharopolyspora sp. K220]|uniref:hypothetical protein n=1 Tax=Saccharopolyspora soli TaxID=2926618 RepID=UPI001F58EEA1|nr:hypothetical protein [Saccharopolyspora soli]MCI2420099.1 hypothetical protein [Saccharopolyspora soli]